MTPGMTAVLKALAADDSVDLVAEGIQVYVGFRRTSYRVLNALLRLCAISDVSDGPSMRRYVISDIGRSLLRRPDLEAELQAALMRRQRFQVIDDRVQFMQDDFPRV